MSRLHAEDRLKRCMLHSSKTYQHLIRSSSTLLIGAHAAEIEERHAAGPKLWLFETRDHGALVAAEGHAKRAIQFEIGNPLTAERMTRHRLAAGLYAPLRIVLYEDEQGCALFEYDLPSSLFNQFGNERVAKTGRELDEELQQVLMAAAG